jgi:hypothetical protein
MRPFTLPAVPDSKGSRFQKRFQFRGRKITRNFGCPWMPTEGMNRWPPVVWAASSSKQVPMLCAVLYGSQHLLRTIRRALSWLALIKGAQMRGIHDLVNLGTREAAVERANAASLFWE